MAENLCVLDAINTWKVFFVPMLTAVTAHAYFYGFLNIRDNPR